MKLSFGPWKNVFHTSTFTPSSGKGKVRALHFFNGAGYCLPIKQGKGWGGTGINIRLRGFSLLLRTERTTGYSSWGGPTFRWFAIHVNPNRNLFYNVSR